MYVEGCFFFQKVVVCLYNFFVGFGGGVYYGGMQEGEVELVYFGVMCCVVFDEVGFFDEFICCGEDWELNLCICQVGYWVWFDLDFFVIYWLCESWF